MGRRYFVTTRLLEEGMVIDQSIKDGAGRVLIARGSEIDDEILTSLKRFGINGVYVREEGSEEEWDISQTASPETIQKIEELTVKDRVKVKLSESVKKRVSEGISFLYSNTDSNELTDVTKNIANELMKAITDNDALAVDIGTLKVSDEYTFKHSVDVATMGMVVARKYGLSDTDVFDIGVAGLLHDIGKSRISNELLNKPGRLTEEEFRHMKQHSVYGYNIIKDKKELKEPVKLAVLQHHEKTNGTGYPFGVDSSKICTYAKILSVLDIYDALVTERPYKEAYSPRDAVEMIMAMTSELDMKAMKSFLGSVILYPVDSIVNLSNGEQAKVVENYADSILRPKVVGIQSGRVYDLGRDLACASIIIP